MNRVTISEVLVSRAPFIVAILIVSITVLAFNLRKPQFPKHAPKLIQGLPVVGSWSFFTKRWDFCQQAIAQSNSNGFSFWAGKYPVIGLHGEASRQIFFENRELSLQKGYNALLGGTPNENASPFDGESFNKRLVSLMKGGVLRSGFPQLLDDVRASLDQIERQPRKVIDTFDAIYRIVFKLTMRTVGCHEIARDPVALKKTLSYFETIEYCGDKPLSIMYPKLWTFHKIGRLIAGIRLYTMFNSIIAKRKKDGHRENDALQFHLDQGDDTLTILSFVMGALFAGQLNTGINAAAMISHLSNNEHWRDKVLSEIESLTTKYNPNSSLSLRDKLSRVPFEAWETDLPSIDLCLKETIRLVSPGTLFRGNDSDDIKINEKGEVIPAGAFVVYPIADVHLNPNIYSNPSKWDPGRYLPDRAEDSKEKHGFVGWGTGRHPCLGMRFAKLEASLITAFWFAYFESELVDEKEVKTHQSPQYDFNANAARKPTNKTYVKYWTRVE